MTYILLLPHVGLVPRLDGQGELLLHVDVLWDAREATISLLRGSSPSISGLIYRYKYIKYLL